VQADPVEDTTPAPPGDELHTRKFQRELSAGLTALVLLAVLEQAEADLYGYEIARRLAGGTEAAGPFKLGALYPVLRNLSAAGLLSSRVVPSYAGPPRRYYRITPVGRDALAAWRRTWSATRDFVDAALRPVPAEETPS
jgi:PadR family transcriptional regulator PadR